MKRSEIHIRDPFVLVHEGKYYLYGTRGETCWGPADGFDVYVGTDLENWSGPFECFHNDGSFWADRDYWAPEVHEWKGRFYMFASFRNESVCRGTTILAADSPMGPFRPHSDGRVTPAQWECLDGTFYVSREGKPYMVFCHEWVQIGDGTVCAMPLTDDLRAAAGEPFVLFRATDAKWCKQIEGAAGAPVGDKSGEKRIVRGYVTDGPFLRRMKNGALACLWASFSESGYTEALAVSDNGEIDGRFTQEEPLFWRDGGHGMLFDALDGATYLLLHSPNQTNQERPVFYPVREENGTIRVDAGR